MEAGRLKSCPMTGGVFFTKLAVLAGLLGGVLSVAYTSACFDAGRKIPEVRASALTALIRSPIGAAIALPVVFCFEIPWRFACGYINAWSKSLARIWGSPIAKPADAEGLDG